MSSGDLFAKLSADEDVLICPGAMVAFSGFTPAGAAKAVPLALAKHARELHHSGLPFQIRILTGPRQAAAWTTHWLRPMRSVGGRLTNRHPPCESGSTTAESPLSTCICPHVPQSVLFGFFGKIDFAVIEASHVTPDGRVYLTNSIGASPTFLQAADKVIIEL